LKISCVREEVAGDWRRLHNEELRNLNASPNNIRVTKSERVRWVGHVACMGETRNAYKILVGRPMHRWEGNVKIDLRELGWEGVDWIQLAQDRDQWRAFVNAVMNLRVS
jgi:hypothetical protein